MAKCTLSKRFCNFLVEIPKVCSKNKRTINNETEKMGNIVYPPYSPQNSKYLLLY